MPAATQAGVFGIGETAQRRARSQVGPEIARREAHQDAERVVGLAEHDLRAGMVDRVCSSTVRACSTSSLVVVPTRNFSLGKREDAFLDPNVVSARS